MTTVDVVFVFLLLVVATILEYAYFWPRLRADAARSRPSTRPRAYQRMAIAQWFFGLSALAIWATHQRPWPTLGLTLPRGSALALACVVVLAGGALVLLQLWSVIRLPIARRIAARPKLDAVAFTLPHTRGEAVWFFVLSITAGFCEELLYRGYLVWFFAPWLGTVGSMTAIAIVFGVSHIYQGRRGAITATLAGAVMAAIVLATGSLIPAMIVHALIDIGSGTVAYWLFRDAELPRLAPTQYASVA